jgi:hypothetical protein
MERFITIYKENKNEFSPKLEEYNFTNISLKKHQVNDCLLQKIYQLSLHIFIDAENISFDEFKLYMQPYLDIYKHNLHIFLLKHTNKDVGFISTILEKDYFIIKTIGIIDKYRNN